jgi:hypothetical protein
MALPALRTRVAAVDTMEGFLGKSAQVKPFDLPLNTKPLVVARYNFADGEPWSMESLNYCLIRSP